MRPYRRSAALVGVAFVVLAAVGACYAVVYPNQGSNKIQPIFTTPPPAPTPTILNAGQLCEAATLAVQTLTGEVLSAPDEIEANRRFVTGYDEYARKLRELAPKAASADQRQLIESAAAAAEKLARAAQKAGDYTKVDSSPVQAASRSAFPGCDFKR
jgi:hypothetical protein